MTTQAFDISDIAKSPCLMQPHQSSLPPSQPVWEFHAAGTQHFVIRQTEDVKVLRPRLVLSKTDSANFVYRPAKGADSLARRRPGAAA
jgi:hypothetical protein